MAKTASKRRREDAFRLIKRFLKICGISMNREEKMAYKIYSVFVLTLNLYPIFQFIGMFQYLENGDEIFEFGVFEAVMFLILIKAMVMVYNRIFMGTLLEKLQDGVFVPNHRRGGEQEEILLKNCIYSTNRQATIYWSVVTVTVVFAVLDSGYSRISSDDYHDWKFEYGRVTIFNTSYSPNYEIASFYQNASWFPVGWTFAVSDLLTVTVLAHITCQLKILQNSIRRIVSNGYVQMAKDENWNVLNDKMEASQIDASGIAWKYLKIVVEDAVEYHLAIIEVAQQIETTFNLLVLLIMLSGIVLIGSLLYKLTVVHIGGVMCILCEIYLICYWGNEVSLESQKVIEACYDVNFFGVDLRLQKAIFLMMERSKRPITFTAGKFTPLTLGTFLWIARTSYSYLMILRRLNNK